MKPIEETHPSLVQYKENEANYIIGFDLDCHYVHITAEEFTSMVQKHTVDQQVLITKLKTFYSPQYADECSQDLDNLYEYLFKELGLE